MEVSSTLARDRDTCRGLHATSYAPTHVVDPDEAATLAAKSSPGVIIAATPTDAERADKLLARLREVSPKSKLVLIANRFDTPALAGLARFNIAAHLLWSDLSIDFLPSLLETIVSGEIIMVSPTIAHAFLDAQEVNRGPGEPGYHLSPREREILPLLARWELHYEDIGARLHISTDTVKVHVKNIERKLDIHGGRQAIVAAAREHGLLALPSESRGRIW